MTVVDFVELLEPVPDEPLELLDEPVLLEARAADWTRWRAGVAEADAGASSAS